MPGHDHRFQTDRHELLETLKHPGVITGIAAVAAALGYLYYRKKAENAWTGNVGSSQSSPTRGSPGQKMVLHGFWVPCGKMVGSVSPYTNKVETFLRFNGLKYTRQQTAFTSTPKGRLPYLQHGQDAVADSRIIVKYLEATYADKGLKTKQPADAHEAGLMVALTHLAEDQYYPSQYFRMYTEGGTQWIRRELFGGKGGLSTAITVSTLQAGRRKQMRYQGVATNSEEEIGRLADEDITSMAGLLGEKDYLLGNEPSAADAAVFGMLESLLYDGCEEGPLPGLVRKHANLVAYVDRIRHKYYSQELANLKK